MPTGLLIAVAVAAAAYAFLLIGLVAAGRRSDAAALARFIPDCLILIKRLLGDSRVRRSGKLALGALLAYLLSPIDLVPDFIPVAGQLDDVLVAALALRLSLRSAGPDLIAELWPGPPQSLRAVLKAAYNR